MKIFKDRREAGQKLAEKLLEYRDDNPIILALPRGGVPVGYEVAERLNASLDTIVARKLGAPGNPEFGLGAIAPNEVLVLNTETLRSLGLQRRDLDETIKQEKLEMGRRIAKYRSGKWSRNASRETIIVVDDGLATGVTARAALESVKLSYEPKKLIFAAPVCAQSSLKSLETSADKVVCVNEPEDLMAIGEWYENFPQTSDEEVLSYLNKNKNMLKSSMKQNK